MICLNSQSSDGALRTRVDISSYEEEHANVPSDVRKAAFTAAQNSALAMSNNPVPNMSSLPTPIAAASSNTSFPPNRTHIPNPEGEPPDMDDMDIEMEDAPVPTPSSMLGNQRQQPRSGTVTPSASPWSVFQNSQNQNHQLPPGGIPQCVPPSVLSYNSNNPPPPVVGNILTQAGGTGPASRFGGGIGLAGLLTPQQQADKAAKKLARKMEKEREKREGHGSDSGGESNVGKEKKFRCPVEGCGKSYKQANGLKYHLQYVHSSIASVPR
jgi:transcription factor SFP1